MIRGILDTTGLWTDDLVIEAQTYLEALTEQEKLKALAHYRLPDRRMSVVSQLLKRLAVLYYNPSMPFSAFTLSTNPTFRKQFYAPTDPDVSVPVQFNISHQADRVAVVAMPGSDISSLGVDIVCVNERNDLAKIDAAGWDAFIDIYKEVFSPRELSDLKSATPFEDRAAAKRKGRRAKRTEYRGSGNELEKVMAKLRKFYACWALKEAYIKMSGQALFAPWLRSLEFRNVQAPQPRKLPNPSPWGEVRDDFEVWLLDERVLDVKMELRAYEEDYMLATAVKIEALGGGDDGQVPQKYKFPPFRILELEKDVLPAVIR